MYKDEVVKRLEETIKDMEVMIKAFYATGNGAVAEKIYLWKYTVSDASELLEDKQ